MVDIVKIGYRADTSDLKRADQDMNRLAQTGGRVDNSAQKLTRTIGALGAAYAGLSVITGAVRNTAEFSQAIADLSAITGAAGQDLEFYRRKAAEIGRTTTLSASQAAQAYQLIASASPQLLKNSEALDAVTRSAVTLAEATGQDLPTAARSLGSAMNQFSLDASRADEVINILAASSQLGTAQVAQVTEALRNAAPAAQSLGIDLAETVSGIQALAASGREGADAGTALRQVMLKLEKTGDSTLQPSVVGLNDAMAELASRTMSSTELMELFGEEGYSAATALLGQIDVLGELNQTLRGTETAYEQARIRTNTFNGDLKALQSAFEGFQLELFTDDVDGLGRSFLQAATGGLNTLTENMDTLAAVGGALATMYGGKLAASIAMATTAKVSDAAATSRQSAATVAATQAEMNYLRVVQSSLAAQLRSSTVSAQQTALRGQLAANTTALTAAQTRLNAAQAAGTLTSRALSGAMGLLGGPAGLIALTTYGIYRMVESYRDSVEVREQQTQKIMEEYAAQKKLNAELEKAGKIFEDTAESTAKGAQLMDNYRDSVDSTYREMVQGLSMDDVQSEIDKVSGLLEVAQSRFDALQGRVAEGTLRYSQAEEAVRKYGAQLDILREIFPNLKTSEEQQDEAIQKVTQSLQDQIFELENGRQAYETMINLRRAGIDAQSAEGQEIIKLIERKYELNAATESESESYYELLGVFDEVTAAENRYAEQVQRITEANLSEAETARLLALAYDELQEAKDNASGGTDSGLQDLIDQVDEFGGSWDRAGSAMVSAFGDINDHLNDYEKRMSGINELQAELTEKRGNYADGSEEALKIDKALADLQEESFQAQINSYGTIAGAASKMFSEQSEARRKLHQLEVTFTAIETAMALQKAVANAVAAVSNQGSGDPYTAFARVAAMSALMAGVLSQAGVAFGSTSGGYSAADNQQGQGAGTVLGAGSDPEAQSESILNAVEITAEASLDQIVELQALRGAMTQLSDGIAQLAVSLVQSTRFGAEFSSGSSSNLFGGNGGLFAAGGAAGIVGGGAALTGAGLLGGTGILAAGGIAGLGVMLLDEILGGFITDLVGGLYEKTQEVVDFGIQFDSQSLAEILATGLVDAAYFNVIEETKEYLWGAISSSDTSTETEPVEQAIAQEFASIFTYIGESATAAIESLGIEMDGSLESFVISLGEISFKDMSGEEIQAELEAIFSQQADLLVEHLVPAMGQFQQMGEGLFETLVRVANEQAQFIGTIERLGFALGDLSAIMQIEVGQAVIDLMGGMENFTDATSKYFEEFYSEAEQLASLESQLSAAFGNLGIELPTTAEGFRALVDSLDLTTEHGQELFAALMELVPWMSEYLDMLDEQGQSVEALADLSRDAFDDLRDAVAEEKRLAKERLDGARAAYDAEVDRVNGLIRALEEAKRAADAAVAAAERGVNEAFDAEIQRQQMLSDERIAAIQSEIDATMALQDAAIAAKKSAEENLTSAFAAEIESQRQASEVAVDLINREIEAVRERIEVQVDSLEKSKSANSELISSTQDYVGELSRLSDSLRAMVGSIAEESTRLTLLRRRQTQSAIQSAIGAAQGGDFSQAMNLDLSALGDTQGLFGSAEERAFDVAVTQQSLSKLADLTDEQLSEEERMLNELERQNESLDKLIEKAQLNAESQIEKLNEQIESEKAYLERTISSLNEQRDSILGVDNSVLSVKDAIHEYRAAQVALEEAGYSETIETLQSQIEAEESALNETIAALNEQRDAVLGVDNSVLSIEEAIREYEEAKAKLEELKFEGTMALYEQMLENAAEVYELHQQAYEDEIARLDEILEDAESQLEALGLIDTSVMSVEDAVKALHVTMDEYSQAVQDAIDDADRQSPEPPDDGGGDGDDSGGGATDPGGGSGGGGGGRPNPPGGAPVVIRSESSGSSKEIAELRKELKSANESIAKSTAQTAKILQRMELGGLDTRIIE